MTERVAVPPEMLAAAINGWQEHQAGCVATTLEGSLKVALQVAFAAAPSTPGATFEDGIEAAAKVCEEEICSCCWTDDAEAAAEHLAERIRALKVPS